MLHRLLSAAAALAVLLTGTGALSSHSTAEAAWRLTSAPAPAAAAAATMPAGQAPTITGLDLGLAGYSYTVTWPSATMVNGHPVTGYVISRATGSGGSVLATGTCAGVSLLGIGGSKAVPHVTGAVQSCTETSLVSLGHPQYRVMPVYGNWHGIASPWATASGA